MKSKFYSSHVVVIVIALFALGRPRSALGATATSLEIGPKETILSSAAIAGLGLSQSVYFPDTPWQVAYNGSSGYTYYFAEGGSFQQFTQWFGTLDNPIALGGSATGISISNMKTTGGNLEDGGAPSTLYYTWMGPTYTITSGADAGDLIGWYSAEQRQSEGGIFEFNGMALSTDGGAHWTDLGEIMQSPIVFNAYPSSNIIVGEPGNVVIDPTGTYFYFYSLDLANTTTWTPVMVSRALISDVIAAAVSGGTTTWHNYYVASGGDWLQPAFSGGTGGLAVGLVDAQYGGLSPTDSPTDRWNTILWNQYLQKYTFVGNNSSDGVYPILYSDSTDGITWSTARVIMAPDSDGTSYLTAVGIEPGISNGPSFADNGEFYLNYESNEFEAAEQAGATSYIARRKVYVQDNFSTDTPGSLPTETGWTSHAGSVTVQASPTNSATATINYPNALKLAATGSGLTYIEKAYLVNGNATPATAPSMDFHGEFYPVSLGTTGCSITIGLRKGSTSLFTFSIFPPNGTYSNYTIQYYNGSTDVLVAEIPNSSSGFLNTWHLIDINATNTSFATISVDHVVYGMIPFWGTGATGIDTVLIDTGSSTGTDCTFYVDNVFLYPSQPTDTFENNVTGALPNGYTAVSTDSNTTDAVSSAHCYSGGYANPEGNGTQSLEIADNSTAQSASVARIVDPTPSKWVEAQIYPEAFGSGCVSQVALNDGNTAVFVVALVPSGGYHDYSDYTLQYLNSAGVWTLVTGGSFTGHLGTTGIVGSWHQIDIDATSTSTATVYFTTTAGTMVGGSISAATSASAIDRVVFGSGSNESGTGLTEYVDNVYIGPSQLNDNNFEFDPAGSGTAPTTPWGYQLVNGAAPTLTTSEAYDGPNSYQVTDATAAASVEKIVGVESPVGGNTSAGKSIDFEVYVPSGNQGPIYIDFNDGAPSSPPSNGGSNTVYRLEITATGLLEYATGGASPTWNQLTYSPSGAATATLGAWNEIMIVDTQPDSSSTSVSVWLNGRALSGTTYYYNLGQAHLSTNWHTATAIDRTVFSCTSPGDGFYLNDLLFN